MTHNLLSGLFILLSLALAYFDLRGWLKSKRIWFMISLIGAFFAALVFWLAWPVGFLFLISAALLFALGTFYKRK
jgi:hypothetical protein